MATFNTVKLALAAASATNIATSQSPGTGGITIGGTVGSANLDTARRILITSGGNDSGIKFTVSGYNIYGNALSETITGANTTSAFTTQDFLSVSSVSHTGSVASTVTVGTNGVASSPWFMVDRDVNPIDISVSAVTTGTINYTVEYTYDDPNAPYSGTFPTVWNNLTPSGMVTATGSKDGNVTFPTFAFRVTQNSFTFSTTSPATVTFAMVQSVLTPT